MTTDQKRFDELFKAFTAKPVRIAQTTEEFVGDDETRAAWLRSRETQRIHIAPCGKHPNHYRLTVGLELEPGETVVQAYVRWCRRAGHNPWCGRFVTECPEAAEDGE